jgi:hypothetical protein
MEVCDENQWTPVDIWDIVLPSNSLLVAGPIKLHYASDTQPASAFTNTNSATPNTF